MPPSHLMIHCLRCRQKTGTGAPRATKTMHGRKMIVGGCLTCGARKSRFVRDGDGIFDKVGDFFKGAANKVADVAKKGYNATIGDEGFRNGFKQGFGKTLGVLGDPAGKVINTFAPGIGTATGHALSYAGNKIAGSGVSGRGVRKARARRS